MVLGLTDVELFRNYAVRKHMETNHKYGEDLPYEYHLKMVVEEVRQYIRETSNDALVVSPPTLIMAAWGHDLIEDARQTYNDVLKQSNQQVADIIYALTNEKGRNRAERANAKYYEGIRNTPGASIVKYCDRIANMEYSIVTSSSMAKMYAKENEHFMESIHAPECDVLKERLLMLVKLV